MEGTEWGTGETEDKMKVGMGGKEGNGIEGWESCPPLLKFLQDLLLCLSTKYVLSLMSYHRRNLWLLHIHRTCHSTYRSACSCWSRRCLFALYRRWFQPSRQTPSVITIYCILLLSLCP